MNNMPPALRQECADDPSYKVCARRLALGDHSCAPSPLNGKLIEWEHALIFAGKQVQEKWAVVPLCWWAHSGPGLVKEINVWLALNQGTDEEIKRISKVVDYQRIKRNLNDKYGTPRH